MVPTDDIRPRMRRKSRFERVDCLVEMGEWATGKGLTVIASDYLRSALDLLYDVEEKARDFGWGHGTVEGVLALSLRFLTCRALSRFSSVVEINNLIDVL